MTLTDLPLAAALFLAAALAASRVARWIHPRAVAEVRAHKAAVRAAGLDAYRDEVTELRTELHAIDDEVHRVAGRVHVIEEHLGIEPPRVGGNGAR